MGILGNGSGDRRLANWLDSWLEYSDIFASPVIFRRWAGIGIIASALERKVWVRTKGSLLYPNLYVVLVGPPGVGKSAALSPSERILRAVPELFIAPSSVTTASLVDALNVSVRKIIRPKDTPNFVQFNSLGVVASELGVFLPAYDPAFMNTLTKMYDGELYEERRRTGKVNHLRIDNPQLNILGGTTPSYLNSFLPEGAWDQGFTSRTIFVFSGEPVYTPIFSDEDDFQRLEGLYKALVHDLKGIAAEFGKLEWTAEAATIITEWDRGGLKPVPEHGKLSHYNSRRLAHTIKLCMIAAIARRSSIIGIEDFQSAQNWLLEAESLMPDIFLTMGVSQDARTIEDAWQFLFKIYSKEQKPIIENRLVFFLKDRVPSFQVAKIMEIMVRSGMIKHEYINGLPYFRPLEKDKR